MVEADKWVWKGTDYITVGLPSQRRAELCEDMGLYSASSPNPEASVCALPALPAPHKIPQPTS